MTEIAAAVTCRNFNTYHEKVDTLKEYVGWASASRLYYAAHDI
jgi:hypothetical protein